jgi:hypothetical protein
VPPEELQRARETWAAVTLSGATRRTGFYKTASGGLAELEATREIARRHKGWTPLALGLAALGPVVGFLAAGLVGALVGLALDLIGLIIGERTLVRTREIERGRA